MVSTNMRKAVRLVLMLLSLSGVEAEHRHSHGLLRHSHHKHLHVSRAENKALIARGQCQFPSDAGLIAVTPGSSNGGWAMSPDQSCQPGHYCPYACPSGQVMAQWDPSSTTYPSLNGGLFCDASGSIQKPFPNKPYCVDGAGTVGAKNQASGSVAFCQTVCPGNEAMIIPTVIQSWSALAVPDTSYWASTAAHFYINAPGVAADKACIWGSNANPVGNWSPYVAGMNQDSMGQTFLKIGWNPIYLETGTPFRNVMPSFGVKVECDGGNCNGLPCAIDPSQHSVNQISGGSGGGSGAAFCVVTVPKGAKANIVVFGQGGGSGGSSPTPSPSSKSSPSSTSSSTPSSTSSSTSSSSSSSSPTPTTTSSSSSSAVSTISSSSSSSSSTITYSPHVFVENVTSTYTSSSSSATTTISLSSKPTKTGGSSRIGHSALLVSLAGFLLAGAAAL